MKIGTSDVSKIYLGSTEVTKVYLGTTEIYSASVTPTPEPSTSDTLVLMHFDDSTNVAACDKATGVTVVADTSMPATIDTADFKFGTGSLASGNKNDADVTITLPETEPSTWTVECWVKGKSKLGNATFSNMTKNDSSIYNGFAIQYSYAKGAANVRTANNSDTITGETLSITTTGTAEWVHIALIKLADGTMYAGLSGTLKAITNLPGWNNVFYIGLNRNDSSRSSCSVDEFRISKTNTLKDFDITNLTYTVPTAAFTFDGSSSGGDTPTIGNNPVVYDKSKGTLTVPAGTYTELDGSKRSIKVTSTTAVSVLDVGSLYLNVETATPSLIQTGDLKGNELDTNIYLGKIDMDDNFSMTWAENTNISFVAGEDSGSSGGSESGGDTDGSNPITLNVNTLSLPAGTYTETTGNKQSFTLSAAIDYKLSKGGNVWFNIAKSTLIFNTTNPSTVVEGEVYLGEVGFTSSWAYTWTPNENLEYTSKSSGGESTGGETAENTAWEVTGQGITVYTKAGVEIKNTADLGEKFTYDTAKSMVPSLVYTDSTCTTEADFKGDGSPIFVLNYNGTPTLICIDSTNNIYIFGAVTQVGGSSATPTTQSNPITYTNGDFTIPAGTYTETTGNKRTVKLENAVTWTCSDVGDLYFVVDTGEPKFITKTIGDEAETMMFLGRLYQSDFSGLVFEANTDISYSKS